MFYLQEFVELPFTETSDYERKNLHLEQRFFNVTQEVKDMILEPMMKDGKEGVGAMGDDTPLAAFSKKTEKFF